MLKEKPQLGYLESISQPLALKTEHFDAEYPVIDQLLREANQETFYRLAPHLFVTETTTEPLFVKELPATPEGYKQFKALLKEDN
ncbi:hypothetical protein [Streptococcus pluranimalium]|uniref:hypothetical protein n=1 Tax=Streptococcus pluranimalium TaxID=82348 RepID=UPI003F693617